MVRYTNGHSEFPFAQCHTATPLMLTSPIGGFHWSNPPPTPLATVAPLLPPSTRPQLVQLLNQIYGAWDSMCDRWSLFKVETIGERQGAYACVCMHARIQGWV